MIDPATLRDLIRDVIAEEVKALKAGQQAGAPAAAPSIAPTPPIRIANDADLAAFAKQVLTLAETPAIREAILAGRHPFKLAAGQPAQSGPAALPISHSHRLDKGVVTESTILKLPAGTSRLVLGPEVSITPLARDKAKSRNISIERARQ
ncbi:hypothetical protein ACFPL7_12005 [Dongia soli]|uniref:Uncharacterized protein n=1 Tax=Dongia soli TaxID=600628 RepID=A0ABU5EGC2_9PROT|nr:hypothetical protein [Dongia soli]MDY0885464.1 hypothetical protein [Dongia soli]